MEKHIISKNETNALKGIAIIIVVLGHFARFSGSSIPLASHVSYYGAALFAFLSGYGTLISYIDHGEKINSLWFVNKLIRVYIPFVIVNVVSLPLYKANDKSIIEKILLGSNDFIMWYPKFIMLFYFIFGVVVILHSKIRVKILLMAFTGIICYIVLAILKMDSQYYTSIFALLAGMWLALEEKVFKKLNQTICLISISIITIVTALASLNTSGWIKYIFVSLSGMSCSILFLLTIINVRKFTKVCTSFSLLGLYSYFCYLTHMKVFYMIDKYMVILSVPAFVTFVLGTIIVAYITTTLYNFALKNIKIKN